MGKCEECGSDNGSGTYCTSSDCGCGALKYWSCKDCGCTTPYYHATRKAKEILEILLGDSPTRLDKVKEVTEK